MRRLVTVPLIVKAGLVVLLFAFLAANTRQAEPTVSLSQIEAGDSKMVVNGGDPPTAGEVPPSLVIQKSGTTDITLAWSASCLSTDDDYAVYQGTLGGVFDTHVSKTCVFR